MLNWKVASCVPPLLCGVLAAYASSAAESSPVAGVWQEHKYSFVFMGFTSTYSCDGLASKLKLLLIAAGARADAKALPGGCASGFGRVDKFASADLTFYTLVPAADAPPTGTPAAATGPSVNGIWRPVALSRYRPRDLQLGDCELVEQFKSNVLPKFTTRNIVDQTTCVPHQLSGTSFNLTFESFAAPAPSPKLATIPKS
ncbi:MAG TPA: hypothetical protein VGI65_15765 [Steroidobacteraceae bacterium]|jgi:hypothetical protein